MTHDASGSGLEAAFLANRERLIRFLRARGAGDAAEDLVHDVWLRIARLDTGPIAAPVPYLFRAADLVMIDRYRSLDRAAKRDLAWTRAMTDGVDPSPEARVAASLEASRIMATLESHGPRIATIFRRHRIDGVSQRDVARELGISLSTVESDLRAAYRALREWRERTDEA